MKQNLNIVAGDTVGYNYRDIEVSSAVSDLFIYPGYQPTRTYLHDLALLMLTTSLPRNEYIKTINLPPHAEYSALMYRGDTVAAYGFGLQSSGGTSTYEITK